MFSAPVQGDQAFQFVGFFYAEFWQAFTEGVARYVQGVWQVVDTWQLQAEGAAVVDHAADRDAAEADAVVAQFSADQARAGALTDGALVGQGDFQGGVRRFRTRVGEEHLVQALGGDIGEALGQFEWQRVAHLEGRSKIQLGDLLAYRFGDLAAAVTGVAAPQASGAIQHLAAVAAGEVHAGGALEQARFGLELAVSGEGHPEWVEFVVFIEHF